MSNNQEWLNTKEVAQMLGVAPHVVSNWRFTGRGPKFLKMYGVVRYRLADVQEFLMEWEKVSEQIREEGAENCRTKMARLKELNEANRKKRNTDRMAGVIEL